MWNNLPQKGRFLSFEGLLLLVVGGISRDAREQYDLFLPLLSLNTDLKVAFSVGSSYWDPREQREAVTGEV